MSKSDVGEQVEISCIIDGMHISKSMILYMNSVDIPSFEKYIKENFGGKIKIPITHDEHLRSRGTPIGGL